MRRCAGSAPIVAWSAFADVADGTLASTSLWRRRAFEYRASSRANGRARTDLWTIGSRSEQGGAEFIGEDITQARDQALQLEPQLLILFGERLYLRGLHNQLCL